MQKEIEMERTKVREDRAKKMAELDNEKVKMEIEVEASRERLERELLVQKAAMEVGARAYNAESQGTQDGEIDTDFSTEK